MAYTAPYGSAILFDFTAGGYTAPAGDGISFDASSTFEVSISERARATDGLEAQATFFASVEEVADATDECGVPVVYEVSISEVAEATDRSNFRPLREIHFDFREGAGYVAPDGDAVLFGMPQNGNQFFYGRDQVIEPIVPSVIFPVGIFPTVQLIHYPAFYP